MFESSATHLKRHTALPHQRIRRNMVTQWLPPWPGLRRLAALKFRAFSSATPAPARAVVPNTFTGFAQFVSKNPTFFQAAINSEHPHLKMVALEMQNGLEWPSFEEGAKQIAEALPQLYFHRFDEFDEIRYAGTIKRLKGIGGSYVAWLGAPGIGKSK